MLTSVEGIYRGGKIELDELPDSIPDETRVIVTFVPSKHVNLRERGISRKQAKELRASLATFAEDWNSPEMDVYDDYDAAKAKL